MRRVLVMILSLILILLMAEGCSPSDNEKMNEGDVTVNEEKSVETEPEGKSAEAAVEEKSETKDSEKKADNDAKPFKIAYIGPLTGNYETYGRHQRQAIELIVDKVNSEGGISGAPIEIEWNDDKSDPNETTNLAYKVCDEKDVLTVFGPFTTTSALATVDIFNEEKMPVCSGSVSNADWSGLGEGRFFRGDATTRQMCTYFADFIIKQMKNTKVAMYYEQSDWGQGMFDEFKAEFQKLGGEIVHQDVFQIDQKDFSASLTRFKEKEDEYELFFLVAHLNEASLLVNQLRKLGIEKTILSNNSLQDQVYVENVGKNGEGQILLSYYGASGNTERFESWKKEYESRYSEPVDSHAFNTTDLFTVMVEAMKKSGNNREKFVEEMHKIADFDGLTTKISMEENGDMNKPLSAFVVKNGEFVKWISE